MFKFGDHYQAIVNLEGEAVAPLREIVASPDHPCYPLAVQLLDRVDRVTKFTRFDVEARLEIPDGSDEARAQRLLEKAEAICLITNSLSAEAHLETTITTATPAAT